MEPQQQLAQSPSIQSQNSWDAPFAMENYALRGVTPEGRTRSNSTVSASSMGGLITLDGVPMATKVRQGVPTLLLYFLRAVVKISPGKQSQTQKSVIVDDRDMYSAALTAVLSETPSSQNLRNTRQEGFLSMTPDRSSSCTRSVENVQEGNTNLEEFAFYQDTRMCDVTS